MSDNIPDPSPTAPMPADLEAAFRSRAEALHAERRRLLAGPVDRAPVPAPSAPRWNGQPCKAVRVTAVVADNSVFPFYWARHLVGTRRNAVQVEYADHTFFLDDEDGSGWYKVTHGGAPRWSHSELTIDPLTIEPRHDLQAPDPDNQAPADDGAERLAALAPALAQGSAPAATEATHPSSAADAEQADEATATVLAAGALRGLIAAALYERSNPGYEWATAHPDDRIAYGGDADAVLAVVLPVGKFLGDQLRDSETQLATARATLDEVLRHFVHKGHPGEPCLQTGWINERTVAQWRAVLYPPTDQSKNGGQ